MTWWPDYHCNHHHRNTEIQISRTEEQWHTDQRRDDYDNDDNFLWITHNQYCDDFHCDHDHDDNEMWISSSWTSNCTQTNGLSRNMIHATTYIYDRHDNMQQPMMMGMTTHLWWWAWRSGGERLRRCHIHKQFCIPAMIWSVWKFENSCKLRCTSFISSCQAPLLCFSWLIPASEIGLLYAE